MIYLNLFLISCAVLLPLYLLGVVVCLGFCVLTKIGWWERLAAALLWPIVLGWILSALVTRTEVEGI